MDPAGALASEIVLPRLRRPNRGLFMMAAIVLTFGFFMVWPTVLLLVNSFNAASDWFVEPRRWGIDNWINAFQEPGVLRSIYNSLQIWALTLVTSFPIAVVIAWVLARTRVPFGRMLEFGFWVAYMIPAIPTTIAWITLLDPSIGLLNVALRGIPIIRDHPFNIFSVGGIVWANLMGHGIAIKVMLLTPAFRNMDASLEEAARVGGVGNFGTMLKITLPLMASPMILVFAFHLLRAFNSFETEYLLGIPFNFFVYSTKIYALLSDAIPHYGEATVLASITLLLLVLIVPLQRWILHRRSYTTITGKFRPGLVDLGRGNYVAFGLIACLLFLLTLGPMTILVLGSFMSRIGYFSLGFTLEHWRMVLSDDVFLRAFKTTLLISTAAAIGGPLVFSVIAYILVRTRLPGRGILDWIVWSSSATPGILTGLGLMWLFLDTPGLNILFGTIWALILVVVLQGNTTGVNIMKGIFVQVGADMEEAARVSGAGWLRTYWQVWLPLLMPSLALLAVISFVHAAGATGNIILLASRNTLTLSLLALEYTSLAVSDREAASIVSIFIMGMTMLGAIAARIAASRFSIRQQSTALGHPGGIGDAPPVPRPTSQKKQVPLGA